MQWPQFNSTSLSFFPLRTSVCFCLIESLQSQGEGGCQRAGEPAVLHCPGTMQRTGVQANKKSRAWETKIIENKEAQRRKPGVVWCSALGVGQFFIKQCQRLRSSVKCSWKEKWDLAISPHWVNKTRNSTLPRRERSLASTPVILVCLGPWQSCTLGTRGETEVGQDLNWKQTIWRWSAWEQGEVNLTCREEVIQTLSQGRVTCPESCSKP